MVLATGRIVSGGASDYWCEENEDCRDALGLHFHCTSPAFPEQYDVFKGVDPVGYVRFRNGVFTVYGLDNRGWTDESFWDNLLLEYDHWNPNSSVFYEWERSAYLLVAANLILRFQGRPDEDPNS